MKASEEESNLGVIMHKSANTSRRCVEGYNTEIAQITGEATVSILHPHMEAIPETWHRIGESAKKSYNNDLGLQGSEVGMKKSWKKWVSNMGEEVKRRPNLSWLTLEEVYCSGRDLWINTPGNRYKLFKKPKGAFGQKFLSAKVVDSWNGFDDVVLSLWIQRQHIRIEGTKNYGII